MTREKLVWELPLLEFQSNEPRGEIVMSQLSSSVARSRRKPWPSTPLPPKPVHSGRGRQRIQDLQKRNGELEALLYGLNHDLRTHLHIITLAADGVDEALADVPLDPSTRAFLARLQRGVFSMRDLLQAVLQVARLGHGGVVLQPVALQSLIHTCLDDLTSDIRATNAQVSITLDLPTVLAEPVLLRTVINNLLSNALKFVAPGVRPDVRITAIERTPGFWCLQVQDRGIGLSSAQQLQLFQPFKRFHDESMYPGYGLGLSTVRMVIEGFGGQVGVDSAPGIGSTFWFELAGAPQANECPTARR